MIKPNNRAFTRGKTGRPRTAGAVVWFFTAECLLCHMALKVNPVTLTLYSSPAGRYHNHRPERPSNLRTLRPSGRSILRTFSFITLLHNPPPTGGHNPRGEAPSTYPSEPSEPSEPSDPGRSAAPSAPYLSHFMASFMAAGRAWPKRRSMASRVTSQVRPDFLRSPSSMRAAA